MIVVAIRLHSARTGEIRLLNAIKIVNDGTGTPRRGNYRVQVGTRQDEARVTGFARKSTDVVELLRRALNAEHAARTSRQRALRRKAP